jgi:diguanylate cyclase (GGDEF)-like protein/PAS domain S-box-containing protein
MTKRALDDDVGLRSVDFADTAIATGHPKWDDFTSLFEFLPIGAYRSSPEGKQLRANPAQVRLNGYDNEAEMIAGVQDIGTEWYVDPDRRRLFWELLERDGFVRSFESEIYRHKTRERIWITENAHVVRDANGRILFCEGTTEEITDRVRAQVALQRRESELRQIIDLVPHLIFAKDLEGRFLLANKAVAELHGVPVEQLLGSRLDQVDSDEEQVRRSMETDREVIRAGQAVVVPEREVVDASGRRHLLQSTKIPFRLGEQAAVLGVAIDITERKRIEDDLRTTNQRLHTIIESCPLAIYSRDLDGLVTSWNPAAERIYGWNAAEAIGRPLLSVPADGLEESDQLRKHVLSGHLPVQADVRRLRKDGTAIDISATMAPLRDGAGQTYGYVSIAADITELKKSEALIWQQANFDALTGLPNRRMLRDRLAQGMMASRRNDAILAILFIDLDHFKEVNDTLGHDRGDLLLVEAASRIRGCVRESDTVARLGGDEFTVLLSDLREASRVEEIAQAIIDALGQPFELGPEQSFVSASIGVALYPADAAEIEDLFKHADQALYVAKEAGRNCFRYFTPALQEAAQMRMRLASDLRGVIAAGQLRVVYQPVVELASGEVFKAEALLRWQHPVRGLISPQEFIPIAEASGMIVDIGDWVFEQAAQQVLRWRELHHPKFQISVNKSPVQFHQAADSQAEWIARLAELGLPGQSIVVEITEGLLLDGRAEVKAQLLQLRDAGIGVSMDDFGTGYSSLSYLQNYDIDYLKIDQSFVRNLSADSRDLVLCKAIIVMAHALGMKVIAEGVETAEQCQWLSEAGCDFGQGYLFARPMQPEAFEAWMESVQARV